MWQLIFDLIEFLNSFTVCFVQEFQLKKDAIMYNFFDFLSISVAKPVKPNVKEVIIHQEKIEVLPKILCKEVTFSIEPQIEDQSYTCCICEEPKHDLLKAKRVRKPVVLFNKDEPKPIVNKTVIFEQKKILPDMALYRWHRGFR